MIDPGKVAMAADGSLSRCTCCAEFCDPVHFETHSLQAGIQPASLLCRGACDVMLTLHFCTLNNYPRSMRPVWICQLSVGRTMLHLTVFRMRHHGFASVYFLYFINVPYLSCSRPSEAAKRCSEFLGGRSNQVYLSSPNLLGVLQTVLLGTNSGETTGGALD